MRNSLIVLVAREWCDMSRADGHAVLIWKTLKDFVYTEPLLEMLTVAIPCH